MVKISERVNIAIHALGYMGAIRNKYPVAVSDLAGALHVSESHLAKVMQRCAKAGFVRSSRGARGGFVLVREPSDVTVLEIIESIEGPLTVPSCLLGKSICKPGTCIMKDLLADMEALLRSGLGEKKLSDFVIEAP